jgi:hypothetical protein
LLSEKRRALIIDECQYLSTLWHQQIRDLHDRTTSFGLLLAGGANTQARLKKNPEIKSRIQMSVSFAPLKGAKLIGALQAFHPILAATDPDLLRQLDGRSCRGNFRNWAHIVTIACRLCAPDQQRRGLNEKLIRAVLAVRP